ncbi:Uncharacterised protein [Segatella copri]|nr:Uncharacterised protein [Segatella copri]
MHAEHTHVERVVARQGRKAEQGSAGRDICLLEEFDEFIMCTAKLYSMTHEGEWFLGIVDEHVATCAFFVKSSTTGPGRPLRAM